MDEISEQLQNEIRAFRDHFRTLVLATCSPEGCPEASLAPFILDDKERPCVYVSELAAHTTNLLSNPRASLLFAEDEIEARNPFARRRLVLQCQAKTLSGDSAEKILEKMEANFGETIRLLRNLPDFHLFAFDIIEGNYVKGFGQAWAISGNRLEVQFLRRG